MDYRIRYNVDLRIYEIGEFKNDQFSIFDNGDNSIQLARKYKKREVLYNGEYSFLSDY